jgi:hypothetical protein
MASSGRGDLLGWRDQQRRTHKAFSSSAHRNSGSARHIDAMAISSPRSSSRPSTTTQYKRPGIARSRMYVPTLRGVRSVPGPHRAPGDRTSSARTIRMIAGYLPGETLGESGRPLKCRVRADLPHMLRKIRLGRGRQREVIGPIMPRDDILDGGRSSRHGSMARSWC